MSCSEYSDVKHCPSSRRSQRRQDEESEKGLNPQPSQKQNAISTWAASATVAAEDDGYSAWSSEGRRRSAVNEEMDLDLAYPSSSKRKSRRPRASDLNEDTIEDPSTSRRGIKIKREDEDEDEEDEDEEIRIDRRQSLTPKPMSAKAASDRRAEKMRDTGFIPLDTTSNLGGDDLEVENQLLGSSSRSSPSVARRGRGSAEKDEEMADSFDPSRMRATNSSSYFTPQTSIPRNQASNRGEGPARLRSREPESAPEPDLEPPEIVEKLGKLLGIKFRTKSSWKWAIRAISHSTIGHGDKFDKMSETGDHALRLWHSNYSLDPDSDVECDLAIHQLVSEKHLGQCAERKKVYQYLRHGDSIQFISNRMKAQCVKTLIAAAWLNRRSMDDVQRAIQKLGLLSA